MEVENMKSLPTHRVETSMAKLKEMLELMNPGLLENFEEHIDVAILSMNFLLKIQ